jgi:hypothetical protein
MGALGMFLGNHTLLSRRIHLVQGPFDRELQRTRRVILAPFREKFTTFYDEHSRPHRSRAGGQRFYLSVVWKLLYFRKSAVFNHAAQVIRGEKR